MSGASVMLAMNSSGSALDRLSLDSGGALKVDLAGSSGGAITADVTVVGDSVGLATEATLSGVATQGTLATASSTLSNMDAKIPSLGQTTKSASAPVTIASDQGALAVSLSASSATATTVLSAVSVTSGSSATSTAVDLDTTRDGITVMGNFGDVSGVVEVLFSADDVTYYKSSIIEYVDMSTGDFGFTLDSLGARYLKVKVTNSDVSSHTVTAIVSHK